MDAGQHDHVGIGARRLARQRQAVADDVGDGVEDLGRLVVMRQDDRVALALEAQDRGDIVGQHRPFEGRDVPLHAPVEIGERHPGRGGRSGGGVQHVLLILILSIFEPRKSRANTPGLGYAGYEDKPGNQTVKVPLLNSGLAALGIAAAGTAPPLQSRPVGVIP